MKRFFLFLAMGFLLAACTQEATVSVTMPDGFKVTAALADTPEKHTRGLMFVKHLPENEGMLFVFDEEEPLSFWMKNTLIDLDMVFIGADKRVTSIAAEVPHSYTYTPDNEVAFADGYGKYVLEIPSKSAARHGLKPGTLLEFSVPEGK